MDSNRLSAPARGPGCQGREPEHLLDGINSLPGRPEHGKVGARKNEAPKSRHYCI